MNSDDSAPIKRGRSRSNSISIGRGKPLPFLLDETPKAAHVSVSEPNSPVLSKQLDENRDIAQTSVSEPNSPVSSQRSPSKNWKAAVPRNLKRVTPLATTSVDTNLSVDAAEASTNQQITVVSRFKPLKLGKWDAQRQLLTRATSLSVTDSSSSSSPVDEGYSLLVRTRKPKEIEAITEEEENEEENKAIEAIAEEEGNEEESDDALSSLLAKNITFLPLKEGSDMPSSSSHVDAASLSKGKKFSRF